MQNLLRLVSSTASSSSFRFTSKSTTTTTTTTIIESQHCFNHSTFISKRASSLSPTFPVLSFRDHSAQSVTTKQQPYHNHNHKTNQLQLLRPKPLLTSFCASSFSQSMQSSASFSSSTPDSNAHANTSQEHKVKSSHGVPLHKLQPARFPDRQPVVLVSCGSFSPITNMHLRIFESGRDYLMWENPKYDIIGGLISPTHDDYRKFGKKNLIDAQHRLAMCELAVESSNWIAVSHWETEQLCWSPTANVLEAYHQHINAHYRHPQNKQVRILLLCGADLLNYTLNDKLWSSQDLKRLFAHGMACIEREGFDSRQLIFEKDVLYGYRESIELIPQRIANNISSTLVRQYLSRGLSIKYLVPDPVIEYIHRHGLYKTPM